ncbi:aspartyl protease family protein [Candidatus Calescamantes bacterium]|nr:aspartyl protease family protein [Candidatus Calescamantes bacterium]
MKIEGYFDPEFKPKAPFVDAIIISPLAKLYHKIRFLIDSGASMTIILDKDVKDCGIDMSKLKRMEKKVSGIGGSIETYLIEDGKIVFETEKGFYEQKLSLFVGIHDMSRIDEETRKKVLLIPSLLGRDILNEFDFHVLPQKEKVYLERE